MKNLKYTDYWGHHARVVLTNGEEVKCFIVSGTSTLDAEDGIPSIDVEKYGPQGPLWEYFEDEIDHIELLD